MKKTLWICIAITLWVTWGTTSPAQGNQDVCIQAYPLALEQLETIAHALKIEAQKTGKHWQWKNSERGCQDSPLTIEIHVDRILLTLENHSTQEIVVSPALLEQPRILARQILRRLDKEQSTRLQEEFNFPMLSAQPRTATQHNPRKEKNWFLVGNLIVQHQIGDAPNLSGLGTSLTRDWPNSVFQSSLSYTRLRSSREQLERSRESRTTRTDEVSVLLGVAHCRSGTRYGLRGGLGWQQQKDEYSISGRDEMRTSTSQNALVLTEAHLGYSWGLFYLSTVASARLFSSSYQEPTASLGAQLSLGAHF